jgi:3-hydroxyacyl-[acyl-carrier-protein] dehydratase
MFKDSLYIIHDCQAHEGNVTATISINANHDVFKGHFPGQPILPGVCSLQIVKEILEGALEQSLSLDNASNLKFLEIIDPNVVDKLTVNISYADKEGLLIVKSVIVDDKKSYYKFTGTYRQTT